MKKSRLLKKTILYFIGNLSSKLLVAMLIPIYAFFVKSEDLGYFDYTQTIMNIVVPIIFLAIWEAILKFLLNQGERKDKIIASSLIGSIAICLIYIFVTYVLNCLNILPIKYYVLVTIMIITYALAQIFQYYARALEENKVYVKASIAGTSINLILVVILIVILKLGIEGLYYSYILGQLSIICIIGKKINILKYFKLEFFDFKILGEMIKFSAPLVLNIISAWLINGYGKIIINTQIGEYANGIYSFANKFPLIITTLGSIISMSIIEEAIITANDKNFSKDFEKMIKKVYKLFACIVTISIPLIFLIFEFFKNTEYYEAKQYIIPLMIYAFSLTMGTNVGAIFQAINKTKYQFITTIIGGAICIIISYFLINTMGIQAVIIGQTLGMLITFIIRYLYAIKFAKIHIDIKLVLLSIIIFSIISIISIKSTNIFMLSIIFIISVILMIIFNKDFIIQIINILKEKKSRN